MRGERTRTFLATIWSVILAAFTVALASPFVWGLRRSIGRGPYWLAVMGLTLMFFAVGWVPLAIAYGHVAVLIGLFEEFDQRGKNLVFSAGSAILGTSLVSVSAGAMWLRKLGPDWLNKIKAIANDFVLTSPIFANNPNMQLDVEDILIQVPSALLMLMVISLFLAMLFEKRIVGWLKMENRERPALSDFVVPDVFIWLLIFSLLGAFLDSNDQWVKGLGVNILNVSVLLYFFQGLAVVIKVFDHLKVGPFWRTLWLIIFVAQLFLVISVVGIVDFWVDFRSRLKKKKKGKKDFVRLNK